MKKRQFIKDLLLTGIAMPIGLNGMAESFACQTDTPPWELAADRAFWDKIRQQYILNPDYINLENGYYNFLPQPLLNQYIEHIKSVNYQGAFYMRNYQWENKQKSVVALAAIAGCAPDELIITRNTTESLDTIIGGIHWQAGDEAIMAEQDYGAMLDMFRLVHERYGVVNKIINIPNHPKDDTEIIELYKNAITSKTKVILVSHMINITGQILPIQKISEMAHQHGVQVIVDGAHAFAHIQFKIADLGCDYYAASLHKWLSVPLGAGILFVKKEHIKNIWPLIADSEKDPNKIRRLNHTGTHPVATDLTIPDAIAYYQMIGPAKKEARLRYLQQYWTSQVNNIPNIILNTPISAARSCAICTVGIKGMQPAVLAERLMKEYKIFTVAIDYANVHGCRITPNLYTSTNELDQLVQALKNLASA